MAEKSKKFKLQTKDKKVSIETDDAIEATRLRAQGFIDAVSESPDETVSNKTDETVTRTTVETVSKPNLTRNSPQQ